MGDSLKSLFLLWIHGGQNEKMTNSQTHDFLINPHKKRTIRLDPSIEKILNSKEGFGFHKSLPGYHPAPLVSLPALAEKLGIGELWVIDESTRFGLNAFKGLGASFAVHNYLKEHSGDHTFCAATDGNHGKALAWICRILNQQCTILVPEHTVPERIESIREESAKVIVVEGNYDLAVEKAKEWSRKHDAVLIQDKSWPGYEEIPTLIMQGYQTPFREMESWLRKHPIDFILIQAGVGSCAASATWYFNRISPAPLPVLVVVEAFETDCILESIRANKPLTTSKTRNTILAGLNCGSPSLIGWEILKQGADAFLSVPDTVCIEAMKRLYYPFGNDPQIISGESGAAGLGGLMALLSADALQEVKKRIGLNRNSKVLIFNTEGITDSVLFKRLVLDD